MESKSQDFRIGNLVFIDGVEVPQHLAKISSLNESFCWVDIIGAGEEYLSMSHEKNYIQIKLIPLTEEILLKCGGYYGYKNLFISIGNKITIDLEDKSFNIYVSDKYPDVTLELPLFVHLFQNLIFALTGEELLINL